MFCQNCGNQVAEGAVFCNKCGAKIVHADTAQQTSGTTGTSVRTVEPRVANTAESSPIASSVINLCTSMCILRFIDAVLWTVIVIAQFSMGIGFRLIVWNIIATGISYVYAVRLLGVCGSQGFDVGKITALSRDNRKFSGICVVWYGIQVFLLDSAGLLFFSFLIEIAILILAFLIFLRLPKAK